MSPLPIIKYPHYDHDLDAVERLRRPREDERLRLRIEPEWPVAPGLELLVELRHRRLVLIAVPA